MNIRRSVAFIWNWRVVAAVMVFMYSAPSLADDFNTVQAVTKQEEGLEITLEVIKDDGSNFPSQFRIAVENKTEGIIDLSYSDYIGPVVFSVSYKGKSGSTRPPMSEGGSSYEYQKLLPGETTYWTYSMDELIKRSSIEMEEAEPGERLVIIARVRFYVPDPTDDNANNKKAIAESLGFAERF